MYPIACRGILKNIDSPDSISFWCGSEHGPAMPMTHMGPGVEHELMVVEKFIEQVNWTSKFSYELWTELNFSEVSFQLVHTNCILAQHNGQCLQGLRNCNTLTIYI